MRFFITIIPLVLSVCLYGQTNPFIGARANGVGYCAVALDDLWSIFNNPAGLASAAGANVSMTSEVVPSFAPFNRVAAAVRVPLFKGGLGAGLFRFGDDLYREQLLTAGFGNQWGQTSLGIKINFLQVTTEGYGRKGALTFSFGGLTQITPWLTVAGVIINVNQPRLTAEQRISSTMAFSVKAKTSEKVIIVAEVEKTLENGPIVKAGIEYAMLRKLVMRTGFSPSPVMGTFGFGFIAKTITIDYAFTYRQIALNHQLSLSYALRKKR